MSSIPASDKNSEFLKELALLDSKGCLCKQWWWMISVAQKGALNITGPAVVAPSENKAIQALMLVSHATQ